MKMLPKNKQSKTNMDYSGIEELFDAEQGLEFYNKDVVKKILKGFGLLDKSNVMAEVLEFGAGTGALAEVMLNEHKLKPICVEISPTLIKILKSKGFQTYSNLSLTPNLAGFVYTSNVLEHIDDDLEALAQIKKKTRNLCTCTSISIFGHGCKSGPLSQIHQARTLAKSLTSRTHN